MGQPEHRHAADNHLGAKQITAAYAPLGAVLVPEDIYQAYVATIRPARQLRPWLHLWRPSARLRARLKAIEIYQRRDILGHVRRIAPQFAARLARLADHPLVGETRCSGLVGGVELVADKETRQPFDPKRTVGASSPVSPRRMARSCARLAIRSPSARR